MNKHLEIPKLFLQIWIGRDPVYKEDKDLKFTVNHPFDLFTALT